MTGEPRMVMSNWQCPIDWSDWPAARLHAPAGLSRPALTQWLGRAAAARGLSLDCAAIQSRADEAASQGRAGYEKLMQAARDMDLWRRELLDGHRKNKKGR